MILILVSKKLFLNICTRHYSKTAVKFRSFLIYLQAKYHVPWNHTEVTHLNILQITECFVGKSLTIAFFSTNLVKKKANLLYSRALQIILTLAT